MELRQLRYLVALSEELSFTRAAERANVAQPALSRQIRKLEDELGTPLVERSSRRVQMTADGQRLALRARAVLADIDDARAEVLQTTQMVAGRLAIGITQTPGPVSIAPILRAFHGRYPGVALSVREELSITIADRLRADQIDLGFVSEIPDAAKRSLTLEEIACEPLVLALPAGHRLAGRSHVDLSDLTGESFILFPEGATIRNTFDRLASAGGLQPKVDFVITDTDRMRELVALGLGLSLLPRSDATRPGPSHAVAMIEDGDVLYRVFLARRRNRRQPRAAVAFAELARSKC